MKYLENGFCVEIFTLNIPSTHCIPRDTSLKSIVYSNITEALDVVKRIIKREWKLNIISWTYDKKDNEFIGKIDDNRSVSVGIVKFTKRTPITKEIDNSLIEVNDPNHRDKYEAPKLKTINYDTMDKPKKRVRKPKPIKQEFYSPLTGKWWS